MHNVAMGSDKIRRRSILKGMTASMVGLAGCGTEESNQTGSYSKTVVFTDSPMRTAEKPGTRKALETTTTTETASPTQSPTASATPTPTATPTATATATPEDAKVIFDGGDLDSFADAVSAVSGRDRGTVIVDPGTYRFDPPPLNENAGSHPHRWFRNLSDVTIEGNGATFVFTNPLRGGFRFARSDNLTIRNLEVDFDPIPFTQGRITDFSKDAKTITLELDEGFPSLNHPMFQRANSVFALAYTSTGEFVQGERGIGRNGKYFSSIEQIDSRRFRLTLGEHSFMSGVEVNNRLVVVARNDETALSFLDVKNPVLDSVVLRTSNGAGFSVEACDNPTFRDCTIAPPPDKTRQLAAVADGIRITNCLPSPTVENCRHEYLGDDSLVVDHRMVEVLELIDDRTIRVEEAHPVVVGVGDSMDAISPTGIRKGTLGKVAEILEWYAEGRSRGKAETIRFQESIAEAIEVGDFVGNKATASSEFTLRGNELRSNRANLIRITTGQGVIENNVLDGASLSAIELHTDAGGVWQAKGWVSEIQIRNNIIRRPAMMPFGKKQGSAIRLHHEPPPNTETEGRPHRDISIIANEIETCGAAGIELEAANGVIARDNIIDELNLLDYEDRGFGFIVSNSEDVTLEDNTVKGSEETLSGFGQRTDSDNISLTENKLIIDGESKPVEMS